MSDNGNICVRRKYMRQFTRPGGTETEQVEAHEEAQVKAQVDLLKWQKDILTSCSYDEKTGRELMEIAGYGSRTGNFKKGLQRLLDYKLLELTISDKPNSRPQKYRLTDKGRAIVQCLWSLVKGNEMYSQHTSALNSTHMCDAPTRIV